MAHEDKQAVLSLVVDATWTAKAFGELLVQVGELYAQLALCSQIVKLIDEADRPQILATLPIEGEEPAELAEPVEGLQAVWRDQLFATLRTSEVTSEKEVMEWARNYQLYSDLAIHRFAISSPGAAEF